MLAIPWLPPMKKARPAEVNLANCNGCSRCAEDCPYTAITMQMRSDGLPFEGEAVVDSDLCVSCGICAGSCPTSTPFRRMSDLIPGIDLPDRPMAAIREEVEREGARLAGEGRIMVFDCVNTRAGSAAKSPSIGVVTLNCIGQLPPSFIDYVISRKLADGVVLAGCSENTCHNRFGGKWMDERLAGMRDPHLRSRVPRERLRVLQPGQMALRSRGIRQRAGAAGALCNGRGPSPRSESMPSIAGILGQGVVYALCAAAVGYLSASPVYRQFPDDSAQIKLSFRHGASRVEDCKRLTPEEIAKLPANERRPNTCARERMAITVRLLVDGAVLFDEVLQPTGLSGDGPAEAYRKFMVPAGKHRLEAQLRDSKRSEGYDYEKTIDLDLVPQQSVAIDFKADQGGFLLR